MELTPSGKSASVEAARAGFEVIGDEVARVITTKPEAIDRSRENGAQRRSEGAASSAPFFHSRRRRSGALRKKRIALGFRQQPARVAVHDRAQLIGTGGRFEEL